ncbi:MAG: hypothetical protein B7Z35_13415 [Hydrogenophilales bacterium 12-61-10]|nr:MAG: hypothetical protein B7Z35_13415 [Hydrogenophilales bacterium 12-61-10]OYX33341.1 MAG: hypothetical protein B7Z03_00480 [Hydrogenophilales bacterium 32-62-9]
MTRPKARQHLVDIHQLQRFAPYSIACGARVRSQQRSFLLLHPGQARHVRATQGADKQVTRTALSIAAHQLVASAAGADPPIEQQQIRFALMRLDLRRPPAKRDQFPVCVFQ